MKKNQSKSKEKVKELENLINEGIDKMYEELKQGKTGIFETCMKGAAKLRYSLGNLMLIFDQCPHASCLKTFVAWSKAGYKVNKGEKAIAILQPRPYIIKLEETEEDIDDKEDIVKEGDELFDEDDENEEDDTTKRKKVIKKTYFNVLHLFDISQVTKVDPNAPDVKPNIIINDKLFPKVEGDFEKQYHLLKEIVISTGIKVEERTFVVGIGVQGASFGGSIAIKKHTYGNMLLVLIHEWAHEILHKGSENSRYSKQEKECQAEAVAYIVGNALNIHSPYSRDYILGWGNDVEEFKKNLNNVIKASNYILNTIDEYCKNNSVAGMVA